MTKLWILRPANNYLDDDDPWNPWYDKSFGFIIRANNENEARNIAHQNAGDENRGKWDGVEARIAQCPWLNPKYSTCEELVSEGETGLIMYDFHSA